MLEVKSKNHREAWFLESICWMSFEIRSYPCLPRLFMMLYCHQRVLITMCLSQPGIILSVDLASRSDPDNGTVYLPTIRDEIQVVQPRVLGLDGTPSPDDFAYALDAFSQQESESVILLDGPQGWRLPGSMIQHMRLCGRVLYSPGRAGELGFVKPKTLQSYVQFSINLFSQLHDQYGWQLITQDWHHYPGRR